MKAYDVTIIGGGIVGLLTAYELAKDKKSLLVIDNQKVGSPAAASSGFTRSLRNDYKDQRYSLLARKAWDKWPILEKELQTTLVIKTGCLNIATDAIKTKSYAREATEWLKRDTNDYREFIGQDQVTKAYPQFAKINYASLDIEAGIGLASKALSAVRTALDAMPNVTILENCTTLSIERADFVLLRTNKGTFQTNYLVIAAGLGSPNILEKIRNCTYRLSLTADRPVECLYYEPRSRKAYAGDELPVFANLDVGIYGHPIVEGISKGVKVGMYTPPEIVTTESPTSIFGVQEFMTKYLPEVARTSKITRVINTDQCSYDMTADGNFVIGSLPGQNNIYIATGFCGTGYKFAPVTAEIIRDLIISGKTQYDISAFSPGRFKT